jgi:hypothetical protein
MHVVVCFAIVCAIAAAPGAARHAYRRMPAVSVSGMREKVHERAGGTVCSLSAYGAAGDGRTDDSIAVQRAFNACANGGLVVLEEKAYLISSPISVSNAVDVRGEGTRSVLLWTHAGDLLVWPNATGMITLADFSIGSIHSPKPLTATAMRFAQGLVKSTISNVLFVGQGPISTTSGDFPAVLLGTCIDLGPLTDTVSVRDVVIWFVAGTGIIVGAGSEVRVEGGRVIGPNVRQDTSVGIHVTGNNGGVHIEATDVIGLHVGILLNNTSGAGSNRCG